MSMPTNGHAVPTPTAQQPPVSAPAPAPQPPQQPVHPTQYQQPAAGPYQQPTQPAPQTPTPPAQPQPQSVQPPQEPAPSWSYDPARYAEGSQPTTPAPQQPSAGQAPSAAPTQGQPGSFLSGVRERFQSSGVDVSRWQSDDDLLNDLVELQKRRPELEQYARLGQQVAPYSQDFQEFVRTRQQPSQPQTPQQPEAPQDPLSEAWGLPPYNPAWDEAVTFDEEKGEYVAAHQYITPNVVQEVNDWHRKRAKVLKSYLDNPYKNTWQAIQKPIEQLVQEQFQRYSQQQTEQQELAQFEQENANWLYQSDPQTKQLAIDPVTRQPVLSDFGLQFVQYAQHFAGQGMSQKNAVVTAMQLLRGDLAAQQLQQLHAQQQQPQPGAPQHIAPGTVANPQAATTPQAQPPAPAAAPPLTPEQVSGNRIASFMQGAMAPQLPNANAAFHQPSAAGFGPNPSDAYAARSFTELDNIFSADANKMLGRAA